MSDMSSWLTGLCLVHSFCANVQSKVWLSFEFICLHVFCEERAKRSSCFLWNFREWVVFVFVFIPSSLVLWHNFIWNIYASPDVLFQSSTCKGPWKKKSLQEDLSQMNIPREGEKFRDVNECREAMPVLVRACQEMFGPCWSLRHLYLPIAKMHWILVAARYYESIEHTTVFNCFSSAIASEWKAAFCSHACLWTAGLEPMLSKCSDWALAHPVQAIAPNILLFLLDVCLRKETGLLDCGLAVHNCCLVFVTLLQLFALIEFLIKAQALHTAGVLWG